ncbi:MAG TPA: PIG-L family deacetylase [Candidatus Limnocylindrales bacterium]
MPDPTPPATSDAPRRLTLMPVHAHPDDETIGTGGVMARAVAEGRRVVLITCTRGELGEIVVPELDTPDNHRRLGELRAAELEAAMAALGVTEWDDLGYRDSDMMGRVGNRDPRCFWQADLDEAIGRLVWLVRRYRPDVMTAYNDFGGYGHPDHIRAHQVAVGAFERAGDAAWYPQQLAPEHGGSGPSEAEGGLAPWTPAKLYEQAIARSTRERMTGRLAELGLTSYWSPPVDATPEQLAEWQAFMERTTVPDEAITTRVDVLPYLERRLEALRAHRTQIAPDFPFMAVGIEGWRELGGQETFILRASRVPVTPPETDLFAGLA